MITEDSDQMLQELVLEVLDPGEPQSSADVRRGVDELAAQLSVWWPSLEQLPHWRLVDVSAMLERLRKLGRAELDGYRWRSA